ncbi:MAG: VacB/RNase II family 3'-5' exoribonuclease, partial [Clostridia bacterium]|nr:VacB/RNase II family 3'-5' exoribonuclease [Clostridia bacterium]
MIKKEELIAYMEKGSYKPMAAQELINSLGIDDIQGFLRLLNTLEKDGRIVFTRKHRYGLPERMGLVIGRLHGNRKGFGFVIPNDPVCRDIHISLDNMNGAMHNDRVMVRLNHSRKAHPEGEVIRVLERANNQVVGTFEKSKNFGFVVPDDTRIYHDVFIPLGEEEEAGNFDKVVVEITRWPQKHRSPEGRVVEVLGRSGMPGVDILSIIRKFNLPLEFPKKVLKVVDVIPQEVTEGDLEGRRDLRSLKTVTIDGADAKDLDDAISIDLLANGNYALWVHIADVSYYVREDGVLDREAYKRANSVYLVDRVVPMLPSGLSNGICSLNAGVDRLAVSVMMEVDGQGNVVRHDVCQSVINVDERMTYDNVRKLLQEDVPELWERYSDLGNEFKWMQELCDILKKKRSRRGSMDFDFPEGKAILDQEGTPTDIVRVDRSIAENIIEEFMILTNETIAE